MDDHSDADIRPKADDQKSETETTPEPKAENAEPKADIQPETRSEPPIKAVKKKSLPTMAGLYDKFSPKLSKVLHTVRHPKTANGYRGCIIFNMMVMSVSFLLYYTAMRPVVLMQSTLIGDLGTMANMMTCLAIIPSNIFLSYRIVA